MGGVLQQQGRAGCWSTPSTSHHRFTTQDQQPPGGGGGGGARRGWGVNTPPPPQNGQGVISAPVQADLNGDGHLEVIIATHDYQLQVGGTGTVLQCIGLHSGLQLHWHRPTVHGT
jgi:hypothetical protein